MRKEQFEERLGDRFRELEVPLPVAWPATLFAASPGGA